MGKTKQKQDRSHYLFSNRELANLIGPLVIEQLLAVFVGMADSIMVANVGEAAVSGVSLVDNIMILIINIFAALATGGAVVAGQYIGRKDEKSACKAATQLVWFVSLSAVAIMILVYLRKRYNSESGIWSHYSGSKRTCRYLSANCNSFDSIYRVI